MSLALLKRVRPEPIELLARRHNYFPRRFMWRGHRYDVHAVEEAWTETHRGGRDARHFFRVRCAEGKFDLFQDINLNAWYLAREVQ
jgi:hypothetical protein